MADSSFSIKVRRQTESFYKLCIGEERFSLTPEELEELLREIKLSKQDDSTQSSRLAEQGFDISADIEGISLETERQMLLLVERLTEIRGIGEIRATDVVELLIKEGLTDISRPDLEALDWGEDTVEKVWLYLLGLRDSVNREFRSE